jgi:DNA-binding FadR family transcriptional regulator
MATTESSTLGFEAIARGKVYQEVAKQIGRHITEDLKPGDLLPSERELALVLGVSRGSVRDAIRSLELTGLLEPRQGELGIEEDSEFDYSIALASDNSVVLRVVDVLMDLLRETRERSLQVGGRQEKSLAGHRRILSALKGRDAAAAEAAMRRHLQEIEEIVLKKLY